MVVVHGPSALWTWLSDSDSGAGDENEDEAKKAKSTIARRRKNRVIFERTQRP